MRQRLLNELEFLYEYRSCILRVFLDWILKQAGLPGEEIQKRCHFYIDYFDKDGLSLSVSRLNEKQQQGLLTFLQTDNKDESKHIQLNEERLFNSLLPAFIKDMKNNNAFSSPELEKYKRIALAANQSLLVDSIGNQIEELLNSSSNKTLFRKSLKDIQKQFTSYFYLDKGSYSDGANQLIEQLYALEKMVEPELLQQFAKLKSNVEHLANSHLVKESAEYARFEQEQELFLKQYKMTSKKCNIIEDVFMKVSGATTLSDGAKHIRVLRDSTIYFTFYHRQHDIEDEIQHLVTFLRAQGDMSTMLSRKEHYVQVKEGVYKNIGYTYYESGVKVKTPGPYLLKEANMPIIYSCNANDRIFREKIWPLITKYIEELAENNPKVLVPYQKSCAEYFGSKTTLSDKADILFSRATVKEDMLEGVPVAGLQLS